MHAVIGLQFRLSKKLEDVIAQFRKAWPLKWLTCHKHKVMVFDVPARWFIPHWMAISPPFLKYLLLYLSRCIMQLVDWFRTYRYILFAKSTIRSCLPVKWLKRAIVNSAVWDSSINIQCCLHVWRHGVDYNLPSSWMSWYILYNRTESTVTPTVPIIMHRQLSPRFYARTAIQSCNARKSPSHVILLGAKVLHCN